eukprot:m.106808 g.106808  ORF g.106808 m.106808 type:complete len:192 (-) comp10601_c0_seq3:171-746(-)
MAFNASLSNKGGKCLIGNYAEERFLADQKGLQTDFNKEDARAALEFKSGNKDIITSGGAVASTTESKSNYVDPSKSAAPTTTTRADRLKQEAYAQALKEVEDETAQTASTAQEEEQSDTFVSTTRLAFAPPAGTTTTAASTTATASLADVPDAPATVWNPSGTSTHARKAKFTEGMSHRVEIDDLIATRQL